MKKTNARSGPFSQEETLFPGLSVRFDQPDTSSDGGLLLISQIDRRVGLTRRLASCLGDLRRGMSVRYELETMLRQRVYGIALGYEDCIDFDDLRLDEAFKLTVGAVPAPQPTLSRFENARSRSELWAMSETFVELFIRRRRGKAPRRIVLDFDATDDPAHGQQEFEFFHGYCGRHCFLPLLAFAAADDGPAELVAAILRPGNIHAGRGAAGLLKRLARRLRKTFPHSEIVFRADAGFALPEVYEVCESENLRYLISLARNSRLEAMAEPHLEEVRRKAESAGFARSFHDLSYAAKTWSCERRVVLKAERLVDKDNPRFVLTDLPGEPEELYRRYCLRGDIENRIKELKLDCFSGRTSCHSFRANCFRLLLHAAAYVLLSLLKESLEGTELARASVGTVRLKLLKVAARIVRTTRRTWVHLPRSCPAQRLWRALLPATAFG